MLSLAPKKSYPSCAWMRNCFVYLIWIIPIYTLYAQNIKSVPNKRCPIKTINYEQGLMSNSINSVITDAMGFTWFSTFTGLQRFNGYNLEAIDPIVDGDSIHINYPVFFLSGKASSILIGYKKGVIEYHAENNSFRKIISVDPLLHLHHSIVPIKATKEGIWCLQENKGVVIYNNNKPIDDGIPKSNALGIDNMLNASDIVERKLVSSNEDYILIGLSPKSILQVNIHTHQFKYYTLPVIEIYGLVCSPDKIFVSSNIGLSCIKISDGEWVQKFSYKQITNEPINYSPMELSRNGRLLVGIEKRLFEFDTDCILQKEITTLNSEFVLNTGYMRSVYEDKFNRIWILANDDIKRIQNSEIPFEHLIYLKEKNNFVRGLYFDGQINQLLVGCFNGGLQLYDSIGHPLWDKPLIVQGAKNILAIEKLSANHYLIETLGNGLYVLDLAKRHLQPMDLPVSIFPPFDIKTNNFSNSLQRVDDSIILISTNFNIFRCVFQKNDFCSATPILQASLLDGHVFNCLIYSSEKTVWAGTKSGVVYKIDPKGYIQSFNIPENYATRCMAEDAKHDIWIGTERGLFIYSASGTLLKSITKKNGLLNDCIYALLSTDGNKDFFASTNLGLSYISNDGSIKNYTKQLGLQENEFNTQACVKSPTGKLYFGGVNGISAFYPTALFNRRDTPIISITRLVVNDSLYNTLGGGWKGDTITLAHNQNHIQIDMVANGLLNPDEYIYQYRMHGFEESWQATRQPTGIRYTLQPGNYLLEINCSPILSSKNEFFKKIWIKINAPWWQTWLFRISAFTLLVAVIAFIAMRYNQQKFHEKILALQMQSEIQHERERISKELHDNIGTQLSYISSNTDWMLEAPVSLSREEEKKRLLSVNHSAKEMIADLRETIWAMKKESVPVDELADRLKLFVKSQRILKPLMEIHISENIQNNIRFSPTEALNVFRICQEAIANSIKHAEASALNLFISVGPNDGFSFVIEDNGMGFSQDRVFKDHYGLENMRSRAEELGAKLLIISEKAKGTKIVLSKEFKI